MHICIVERLEINDIGLDFGKAVEETLDRFSEGNDLPNHQRKKAVPSLLCQLRASKILAMGSA